MNPVALNDEGESLPSIRVCPRLRLKFQEKWYNENRILLLQCFLMFSLMHFKWMNGASQTWSMIRQFPARGLGYLFSFEETLDAIPVSRDCFALSQFERYDFERCG